MASLRGDYPDRFEGSAAPLAALSARWSELPRTPRIFVACSGGRNLRAAWRYGLGVVGGCGVKPGSGVDREPRGFGLPDASGDADAPPGPTSMISGSAL